jgi:hypothetical protein
MQLRESAQHGRYGLAWPTILLLYTANDLTTGSVARVAFQPLTLLQFPVQESNSLQCSERALTGVLPANPERDQLRNETSAKSIESDKNGVR